MSGRHAVGSYSEPSADLPAESLRQLVAATLMPGFVGTELPPWLAERLRAGLGGVCIFGQNITSRSQLRTLTEAMRSENPGVVVAIDEEGGDVTRLYHDRGSPYPGAAALGRIDDLALTERVGALVADELAAVGVTLNFAPDADVNSNPDNPVIGSRSFGTDPHAVARHVDAWVRGHEGAGIAVSAKHFPGHGDTATDSHLELPVIEASLETLRARELVPFRAAIGAGARTVMTSHILVPSIDPDSPATHSRLILQRLLRDELDFDGVIVSDAIDMRGASGVHGIAEAAVRAIDAGCDLLCLGTENTGEQLRDIEDAVISAVESGRVSVDRLSEAAERVAALGASTNARLATVSVSAPGPGFDPDAMADEPAFDLDVVAGAFELSSAARAWLEAGTRPDAVVRIDTVANIAVGITPWGPFASLAQRDHRALPAAWSTPIALSAQTTLQPIDAGAAVIVVGRDLHRHPFARDAVDELRSNDRPVLVVDMGWPSDDRRYADIATFGASRLLGEALIAMLDGDGGQ